MSLVVKKNDFKKFYCTVLPWIPVLNAYNPIPGVSLGEIILIFCLFFSFLLSPHLNLRFSRSDFIFCLFVIYSFISTFIVFLGGDWYQFNWLNRVIRFSFYGICILYTSKLFFDESIFIKSMNALTIITFIGIVFQYCVYYIFGRYITLYDAILPVTNPDLLKNDYEYIFRYTVFRPSSIFTEPSAIAQTLILGINYHLFNKDGCDSFKKKVFLVLGIITVLLSKSLWGYLLLLVVFLLWFVVNLKVRHTINWYFFTLSGMLLLFVLLFRFNLISDTLSRLKLSDLETTSELNENAVFSVRFGGYYILKGLPLIRLIFGSGFSVSFPNRVIANSFLLVLAGEGIIGVIILFSMFFTYIVENHDDWKKKTIICFFILIFGSNIFFSVNLILWFSCIFSKKQD